MKRPPRAWLESAIAEHRAALDDARARADTNARHAEAARATARVAIEHLQAVLNTARTSAEQDAARDWLRSIGADDTHHTKEAT